MCAAQRGALSLSLLDPREQRACRRVVKAKDIAKLDPGITVMLVVIFRQNDVERAQHRGYGRRGFPSDLARMAPPDVHLPDRQPSERPLPGETRRHGRDRHIRYGPEKAVQEHPWVEAEDRVVKVGAAPVVVRAQVEREPCVLGDVVEEGGGAVACYEHEERGQERHRLSCFTRMAAAAFA